MTKKRSSTSVAIGPPLTAAGMKVVMAMCTILLALAILILHSHEFSLHSSNFTTQLSNRDAKGFQLPHKIAFLFLARQNLPLDFVWDYFLKNGDKAKYTIYIHSKPGFVFDKSTTKSPSFYGRQLNNSIQVIWGESTMIEAERLLLSAALEDPANQRFVLLSERCVPLYNFSHTYSYIMSSSKSFVDSFLNIKEGRYNPDMSPTIPIEKWRKGSQWITLVRNHAEAIVEDSIVFPLFKKLCKRWRPTKPTTKRKIHEIDFRNIQNMKPQPNCIPDEHYVQTLLSIRGFENELERRTLTYTLWNKNVTKGDKKSWHPLTIHHSDATPEKIKEIKEINHIDYESEHRIEWCSVNSKPAPCFLFARKFTVGAAQRLLNEGYDNPAGDAESLAP